MCEALALDPLCYPADLFGFVRPATTPTSPTPSPAPFVIVPVPGKGLGAIATRDIAKGELVFAEKPLFLVSDSKRSPADIALHVARLPPSSQAAYHSLARVHSSMRPINDIFVTNALTLGPIVGGEVHAGVFEIASRFNHDCTPTLHHHWNSESKCEEFSATRNIALGEELSIVYFHLFAPRRERHAALTPSFRFVCTCSTCSLPPAELAASDARRVAIQDALEDRLSLLGRDPEQLIVRYRQAIADIDAEGLVPGKPRLCHAAFQVCGAYGDYANAALWAKLGVECAAYDGDNKWHEHLKKCVANPRGDWPVLNPTRTVGGPYAKPAPTPPNPGPGAAFAIVPIPGKGMGAIATRDIAKGELVLAEKPFLVIAHAKKSEESIALFLARLPPASQAAYHSLTGVHPEWSPLLDIFETNVLPLSTSEKATHGGVFELACRFNHDCTPCLDHHWNAESQRLELVATRRVARGEELSIYYINLLAPRADRLGDLLHNFRFLCTCSTCSLPDAAADASDTRRKNINDFVEAIPAILQAREPGQLVVRARQALADLAAEGLVVGRTAICYDAFQVCTNHGDYENARLWAKLGLECAAEVGDHSLRDMFRKYVANPSGYHLSGTCGKWWVGGPKA